MTARDILSVFGAFAGFLAILLLAYWAVKLMSRGYMAAGEGRLLQVVERIALGPDKQLLVVKTADRVLLLGVTAHHIEKLEELDPALLPPPLASPRGGAFLDVLKETLDFRKKGRESGDEQHTDEREP